MGPLDDGGLGDTPSGPVGLRPRSKPAGEGADGQGEPAWAPAEFPSTRSGRAGLTS